MGAKFRQKPFNFLLCLFPAQALHGIPGSLFILADIVRSPPRHSTVAGADGQAVNLVHIKIPAIHATSIRHGRMIPQQGLQITIANRYQTGRTGNNGLASSFVLHSIIPPKVKIFSFSAGTIIEYYNWQGIAIGKLYKLYTIVLYNFSYLIIYNTVHNTKANILKLSIYGNIAILSP